MLEKWFQLKKNGTTVQNELIAGVTTFMAMAYILAVNPAILADAGIDKGAQMIATALAAFAGTLIMGLMANYPFALAPGLGINAFFAYTICGQMGYSWQVALLFVFVEGIIFIVLSLTSLREKIFDAIPLQMKNGISVGIGLLIAFIGLQNAHIIVASETTLVRLTSFRENFHTEGICALLALVGFLIIVFLQARRVKGAVLIGILATWALGMICQLAGIYTVDPENGFASLFPIWSNFDPAAIRLTFAQCFQADLSSVPVLDVIILLCTFLYMDTFDTLGALIGMGKRAHMLDEKGRLPRIRQALLSDALATSIGAVLGTSTTTTFAESSTGVEAGGRTGLSSVVTAFLFLGAIFLAPVFIAIPGFATAPALIYVGFMMFSTVVNIDFHKPLEAVPAYLCIIVMTLSYSISEGIAFGMISYVVLHVVSGRAKEVKPLLYIFAILFVLKYIFL